MEKDKIVSMQDIRRLSEEGVPVVSCLIIILSFKYKCNITFENIGVMLSNRCITDDMLKDSLLNEGFYNMHKLKEIPLLEKFD